MGHLYKLISLAPLLMLASCSGGDKPIPEGFAEQIELEAVVTHLQALEQIAINNGGNRVIGSPGFAESLDYVSEALSEAGYQVERQSFPVELFTVNGEPRLEVANQPLIYQEDFAVLEYSGSGQVSGDLVAVDLDLGLGNTTTSGCEPADFQDFPAGSLALIQRGTCNFSDKAINAQSAGAAAVLLMNQGDVEDPGRLDLFSGTLGSESQITIPVLAIPYARGAELADTREVAIALALDATREEVTAWNLWTEKEGQETPEDVLMLGAHLDSVAEGPGINDNGSGSASILEVALELADYQTANTVRFAWWGAEEQGLVGSTFYVDDLKSNAPAELARIKAYLNFDMTASGNYGRFITGAVLADDPAPPPPQSQDLAQVFVDFFELRGLPYALTPLGGRTDFVAFAEAGIPVGSVFTGAEGSKAPEEAELFGGTVEESYDPCYHQECDTLANLDQKALGIHAQAIGHAVAILANRPLPDPVAAPASRIKPENRGPRYLR